MTENILPKEFVKDKFLRLNERILLKNTSVLPTRLKFINILTDDIKTVDYCYVSCHDYCNIIVNTITEYINLKKELPEKLIERFFKVIVTAVECWSYNYDINILHSLYIIKNIELNYHLLKELFKTQNSEIIKLYLNYKNNMSNELLIKILDLLHINKIVNDNDSILKYIINNALINNNIIALNTLMSFVIKHKYLNDIELLLDSKIKPSDDLFIELIVNYTCHEKSLDLIKKCIFNGIIINKNCIDTYIKFISKSKIYVSDIPFTNTCNYLYDHGAIEINFDIIIEYNQQYNKYGAFTMKPSIFQTSINHFVDNDYKLSKNDFLLCCKNKIMIKDIKKIQHYFDDIDIQFAINEFDLNYPIKINYTIEMLRNECKKKNNIQKIKKITTIIKPDITCLENACNINCNKNVIQFFLDKYKILLNDKCIINFAQTMHTNSTLEYILTKYNKT